MIDGLDQVRVEARRDEHLVRSERRDRGLDVEVVHPVELLARAVHFSGPRRERPFVAGRNEYTSDVVLDDLGYAADRRCDDGPAECHRFEQRQREVTAQDGRELQRPLLRRRQPVDPRGFRRALTVSMIFYAVLTLPFVIITLGLFLFVVNALMLWLTGYISDLFGLGFQVDGFGAAFVGALVVTVVSFMLSLFVRKERRDDER